MIEDFLIVKLIVQKVIQDLFG